MNSISSKCATRPLIRSQGTLKRPHISFRQYRFPLKLRSRLKCRWNIARLIADFVSHWVITKILPPCKNHGDTTTLIVLEVNSEFSPAIWTGLQTGAGIYFAIDFNKICIQWPDNFRMTSTTKIPAAPYIHIRFIYDNVQMWAYYAEWHPELIVSCWRRFGRNIRKLWPVHHRTFNNTKVCSRLLYKIREGSDFGCRGHKLE